MTNGGALDAVSAWIKKRVSKRDAGLLVMSFLIILAVHLFAFTNKLINHDDLSELLGGGSLLASGRWLLNPVMKLTGRVSMPALYGLVGAAFLALTVLTVLRVLRVRRYITAAAVALAMAAHPTVVCTWAYMFTAPAYFFAMFLAVLGVYFIRRRGWLNFAAGAALVGMSMGCYQAYISLAATLAVLALVLDICDGAFEGRWKPAVSACVRSFFGLLAGLAIYFAVLRLCLRITGTELLDYAGINNMGRMDLLTLVKRVRLAYIRFVDFPQSPAFRAVHSAFPALLTAGYVIALLSVILLAVRRRVWETPVSLVILMALVAVAPLAADLVYVMADEANVHWLMRYATVLVWIFPAAAAERFELPDSGGRRGLAVALSLVLLLVTAVSGYESALVTNKVYLEMELTRESANSFLTRLLTRIEEREDYTPDAKVALIGNASMESGLPNEYLTGIFTGGNLLNIYSRSWLLTYYHGFSRGWVSDEEIEAIKATEKFAGMPAYPAFGSIENIDGIITVKLSEE